jgi:hypothetical protein
MGYAGCRMTAQKKPVGKFKLSAEAVDQWGKAFEALGVTEKPESILAEAIRITGGDRQQSYGSPKPNHDLIAAGWSILLGKTVTAEDVCRCMIWSKLSRDMHSAKRDNTVDIAGYAWVLEECREPR